MIFQVDEDFTIPSMRPAAYVLQRHGQVKDVGVADGEARPQGSDQLAFGTPPQVGDALYLGFEEPLDRLIVQIEVDASQARGAGVNPEDPPLRWEVSQADGQWAAGDRARGPHRRLQLRLRHGRARAAAALGRRRRSAATACTGCAAGSPTTSRVRPPAARRYSHAPEIYSITRRADGRAPARRRTPRAIEREILGVSDGTPGQIFPLRNQPVLKLGTGETLEVQDPESGDWARWECAHRTSSARPSSTATSSLDLVSGEVELGPAIRETDGGWTQYGAVPPKGAVLRFTRYRHGGGRDGNVTAGTLSVLKSTIAGIDTVTNPDAATGGVDAEIITHARQRASMEIRSRYRAVTAEDFEFLAGEASPRVARAVCIPPRDGGAVPLHLVPRIYPADRRLDFAELMPEEELLTEVAEYLDERRLIGTTVELKPCRYRGLSRRRQPAGAPAGRHRARRGGRRARALHVPEPARRRQPDRPGRGLGVRPRAQPGRALRRRARRRRRRVRAHPAPLRDQPRDRRAVGQAGRHAHRPRARRADGVGPAHRQGHAPRGLVCRSSTRPGRRRQRHRPQRRRRRPTARGNGHKTFGGAGLRHADDPAGVRARRSTPPVASTRAYLRNGLPSLYQDGDFGMRFVGALEELLDPIVAVLDGAARTTSTPTTPRPTSSSCSRPGWASTSTRPRTSATSARWSAASAELGRRRGHREGPRAGAEAAFPRGADARRGQRRRDLARASRRRRRSRRRASSSTATCPSTRPCRRRSRAASSSTSRCTARIACA